MPDAAPEADVVGNLDAALLERLWAIFDVALEVVQRPEEPCGEPSAEQWSRLHLALAAVPECQRDKPLLSAAEIERLRAEVAELRARVAAFDQWHGLAFIEKDGTIRAPTTRDI